MAAKKKKPTYRLHIISDATGNVARHVVNAVMTQFPGLDYEIEHHILIDDIESMQLVTRRLERGGKHQIVLHALIEGVLKNELHATCRRNIIPEFDLTGSLSHFIADHTGIAPTNELSLLHKTDAGYFQRIQAMEFTAQHDDSRRIDTIHEADVVVIGLSRVSKSPTSTFLGSMGFKVANVSMARELGFPKQLYRVRKRVVAFTVQPKLLHETRQKRFEEFSKNIDDGGMQELGYTNLRSVISEVVWAESEYRKRNYPIIDITGNTVEETAAKVIKVLGLEIPRLLHVSE